MFHQSATDSLFVLAILLGLPATVYAAPTLPPTSPGELKRTPSPILSEIAEGILDVVVDVPTSSPQEIAIAAADLAAKAAKKAADNAKDYIKRREKDQNQNQPRMNIPTNLDEIIEKYHPGLLAKY